METPCDTWDPVAAGVVTLPSGRRIRGRGLSVPLPDGPEPDLGIYLLGSRPEPVPWESWWLRWPDFGLPSSEDHARTVLHEAWERAAYQRVEVACAGGRGRTGTALACIAVLDGVPAADAVVWIRASYHPRAVETPWQRRWVRHFGSG